RSRDAQGRRLPQGVPQPDDADRPGRAGTRRGVSGMAATLVRTGTVLKVNEIFHSIQGESRHAGRPCVFVRLSGCNLRCVWCDTAYAFEEGSDRSVGEILEIVAAHGTRYVLVTGGEPLAQRGIHDLLGALLDRGYEVALETGGGLDITSVDGVAVVSGRRARAAPHPLLTPPYLRRGGAEPARPPDVYAQVPHLHGRVTPRAGDLEGPAVAPLPEHGHQPV